MDGTYIHKTQDLLVGVLFFSDWKQMAIQHSGFKLAPSWKALEDLGVTDNSRKNPLGCVVTF